MSSIRIFTLSQHSRSILEVRARSERVHSILQQPWTRLVHFHHVASTFWSSARRQRISHLMEIKQILPPITIFFSGKVDTGLPYLKPTSKKLSAVHNTDQRLSAIESLPLPTSLEELRDVSLQLANIARSILTHQEHHPINKALEELSAIIESQIDRAVDLNDQMRVIFNIKFIGY